MSAMEANWFPVDALLEAAEAELQVGEMVQCEGFSLFDAMSAVEIGNNKMDSTAIPAVTAAELIEQGKAPTDLTIQQQLTVMDKLIQMEASHYCLAAPPAASIYTSLYMMHPERIAKSSPILYAFCVGLESTFRAIRWLVFSGAVFEDEDYSMLVMGLPCEASSPPGGVEQPSAACVAQLKEAVSQVAKQAQQAPSHEAKTWQAVEARLQWRLELHQAILDIKAKSTASVASSGKHLQAALAALTHIQTGTGSGDSTTTATDSDDVPGFVDGLNRHLMGPAPPRVVKLPDASTAYSALKTMIEQMQSALEVAQYKGYREVQRFIYEYARREAGVMGRSTAHYLIAGSVWQQAASLAPAEDHASTNGSSKDSAAKSISDCPWALDRPLLCEAVALPAATQIGEEMEVFLEQAAIAIGNWAQSMLLNPCRTRRRLRRGMDDWANLYQHALHADLSNSFNKWIDSVGWNWVPGSAGPRNPVTGDLDLQGPLATWMESLICSAQLQHLYAGFTLDLYSAPEYTYLYWYICNLLQNKSNDLALLHEIKAPADGKPSLSLGRPGGKGKARQPKPAPVMSAATQARQSGLMLDRIYNEHHIHMAAGLLRITLALSKANLMPKAPLHFNTLKEWFDQRFGCFHHPNLVRPDALHYEQFLAGTSTDKIKATQLLDYAKAAFNDLRATNVGMKAQVDEALRTKLYSKSQQDELEVLSKIAAANTVACNILAKIVDADAEAQYKVSFDFSLHPYYPVIKLKSATTAAK